MKFTSGLPETACGAGSTMRVTAQLRFSLPGLLEFCGIKKLLDAPCGDCNWISRTDLPGVEYIGMDASSDHLQLASSRVWRSGAEPESKSFVLADLLTMAAGHQF
jgi:hypothetical protein